MSKSYHEISNYKVMYGFFHVHSPVFAQYQYAEPLYGCQGLFNSYALSLSRTTLGYVSFSYLP